MAFLSEEGGGFSRQTTVKVQVKCIRSYDDDKQYNFVHIMKLHFFLSFDLKVRHIIHEPYSGSKLF
jgi:hypothetical protein